MDFDPDHAKWQCCCCHLASGLKILAIAEIAIAGGLLLFGAVDLYNSIQHPEKQDFVFDISVILMNLIMILGSALLIVGISKTREKLMYPTLAARILLIVFVTVFGVKQVVVEPEDNARRQPPPSPKFADRKYHQQEPPMVLRLVFFVFLMIFLSIGVFYTIYLVVRCIRYIQAYARLERRRASLIFASQIDPEFMRRSSKTSNI